MRPAGDGRGDLGGAEELFLRDFVRVGVAGLVAGDHADAGALADAEDRALELVLFDEDLAGDPVLDVDVGEIAALGEGAGDRPLEEAGVDRRLDAAGRSGSAGGGAAGEERGEQGGGGGDGHAPFEAELEEPAPGDVGIEDLIRIAALCEFP